MLRKIEDFLLNKFAGKLISRGAALLAGVLAAKLAALHVSVDPIELAGALALAANGAFEWFKARRMANPASPAVQTDASKPSPAPGA